MLKGIALFVLAIMISAAALIETRHESRLRFAQLQALQNERDGLNTEWGQLLLEEGTWSEHRRVELMAHTRLEMSTPGRDRIVVVAPHRGDL